MAQQPNNNDYAQTQTHKFRLSPQPRESGTQQQQGRKRSIRRKSAAEAIIADCTPSTSPANSHKRPRNNKQSTLVAPARTSISTTIETIDLVVVSTAQQPPLQQNVPEVQRHGASFSEEASVQHQAGKPPTRKKKHGGSLTHLPLHDNFSLEKTMSEEDLEQRRIESANYITDQILELGNPGVTVGCHQGRIRDWKVRILVLARTL